MLMLLQIICNLKALKIPAFHATKLECNLGVCGNIILTHYFHNDTIVFESI